ncbi:hypothetical protein S83_032723, partial [Arachis hypogaea]
DYLGALDDTYIEVTVPESDSPKYRVRKGKICINVLGIGWEGSSDPRILQNVITRSNGLKISQGNHHLVD